MAVVHVFAQAYVDPKLKAAVSGTLTPVQVVVTFKGEGSPSALDVAALTQAGITQGLTLNALPIAGVLATASQVSAPATSPRVLSLYINESLQYENSSGTALTGVDKARGDLTFTA